MDSETTTIDLTPTWEQILPSLILVYDQSLVVGSDNAGKNQMYVLTELTKMAKLADLYVKSQK